jgi:D-alanyl-D-alanine carboxypeptidase (penicillin-binding protein 5/6)
MAYRRNFNLVLALVSVALLFVGAVSAEAAAKPKSKSRNRQRAVRLAPLPLEQTAQAYLLVDATSGAVLTANNPYQPLIPASLTKIMTLRLTFAALRSGRIHLADQVTVSKNAWGGRRPLKGSSLMFLQPGRAVTVRQLIEGAAVASANDACVALAEHIAGSMPDFVAEMNAEAGKLGLATARFYDPHGLSTGNRISAADMARLALSMLRDYPEYLEYASKPYMTYMGIAQRNHLRLLDKVDGVDGFKTGYLSMFGYNVVVTAMRGDKRLLAVVMGTPPRVNGRLGGRVRDQLAAKLLNTGFDGMQLAASKQL